MSPAYQGPRLPDDGLLLAYWSSVLGALGARLREPAALTCLARPALMHRLLPWALAYAHASLPLSNDLVPFLLAPSLPRAPARRSPYNAIDDPSSWLVCSFVDRCCATDTYRLISISAATLLPPPHLPIPAIRALAL